MELFGFDKKEVERTLIRELKIFKREKKSFEYVFEKLKSLNKYISGDVIELPETDFYSDEPSKWKEGKNYHWIAVESGNVRYLIRSYSTHYTIFQCVSTKISRRGDEWTETKYGAFEFFTDTDLVNNDDEDLKKNPDLEGYSYFSDFFNENHLYDINNWINLLIKHSKDRMDSMWIVSDDDKNFLPKRIQVKDAFDTESDFVTDVSKTIFCCEELSNIELELFAENDMIDKIKTIKVGDMLGAYKVTEVNTKVKDGYYHDAGLSLQNTNFKKEKSKWQDVYSLCMFYFRYVFPEKESVK